MDDVVRWTKEDGGEESYEVFVGAGLTKQCCHVIDIWARRQRPLALDSAWSLYYDVDLRVQNSIHTISLFRCTLCYIPGPRAFFGMK